MIPPKKVMVGMSGGVDSSVAALLLKRQGYEVAGGTFRLWDSGSDDDVNDAAAVCGALGIPHYIFDFKERFRHDVIGNFAGEYERGATPNPCVVCNRVIKFGSFLEKARELGYGFISTGHYAHIIYDAQTGRYRVKKSARDEKDQSYVLYSLTQEQLAAAVLPLGDLDKQSVRELAEQNNLAVSRKAESQDICFIPDGDYAGFLNRYWNNGGISGNFLDMDGNILGAHKGIRNYTIGQRKGIGISFDKPMYVSSIDAKENTVTLAPNDALMQKSLTASHFNWIDEIQSGQPVRVKAKIRYNAKPADATVISAGASAGLVFDEPQRAITIGQSVVLYDGGYIIGGGVIDGIGGKAYNGLKL